MKTITLLVALFVLPLGFVHADDDAKVTEINTADQEAIIIEKPDGESVELNSPDRHVVVRESDDEEFIVIHSSDGNVVILKKGDAESYDLNDADRQVIVVEDREQRIATRTRTIGERVSEMAESIGEWAGQLGESIGESFSNIGDREQFARAQFGNSREINETVPMQPGGRLSIENIAGKVTVQGWDKDQIQVVGIVGEDVDDVNFDVRGGDARIEVEVPNGRDRKIRTDLTISVPRRSSLAVETVSAKIEVRGVEAENHRLETVSGSIDISDTTGNIDIETVSGQVTVNDADSHLKIDSVSGSIKTEGNAQSVDAETVSGSVQILGVQQEVRVDSISGSIRIQGDGLGEIDVETVSGSVTFDGTLSRSAEVDIHTLSGSVHLNIDGELPGEFDLNTASGSINCSFGPKVESRRGPGQSLRFDLGTGDGDVRIETFSGSINIRN